MQTDQTPTEGNHSANQDTEGALDGATCSPDSVGYCIKTKAVDGSDDEAWLEVRGKGAVKHMQLDVHYAQPWMSPTELVRHLRQIADQVEILRTLSLCTRRHTTPNLYENQTTRKPRQHA